MKTDPLASFDNNKKFSFKSTTNYQPSYNTKSIELYKTRTKSQTPTTDIAMIDLKSSDECNVIMPSKSQM